jgi:hypothetical protein
VSSFSRRCVDNYHFLKLFLGLSLLLLESLPPTLGVDLLWANQVLYFRAHLIKLIINYNSQILRQVSPLT